MSQWIKEAGTRRNKALIGNSMLKSMNQRSAESESNMGNDPLGCSMAITLQEIRSKYPQYHDKSDIEMADAIHKKYYSDIPKEKVYERLGIDITGRQGGEITEEAEVGDDDSNTTGVLGVVSDLASGLGNAYKRGVNLGNTSDMVEELGESYCRTR